MNEVNMLNIGGVDYNIDDQYARDLIAHSENGLDSQSNLPISSRHYDEGEYLIGQDRYYYEATTDIDPGDVLAEGTNLRKTLLSDEIVALKNQSSIAVIQCIAKRETGALATSSYPIIGSYLYWDYGLTAGLYETIAAITAGDALTIGVNLKSANKIADTMDGLQDAYNITGAKNLCSEDLAQNTVKENTTYTFNTDGSINVVSPDNGPTISNSIHIGINTLPAGVYKLTCLAGSGSEDQNLAPLAVTNTSGTVIGRSSQNGGMFTLSTASTVWFWAEAVAGYGPINTRVFPMCRVASITDESYVPFAMTNKQLTDKIFIKMSTSEYFTGKYWIDGRPIYGKVIDFGNLSNASAKSVNHNISGLSYVVSLHVLGYYPGTSWQQLNWATSDGIQYTIRAFCTNSQVTIVSGSDRSDMKAYITIEYIK